MVSRLRNAVGFRSSVQFGICLSMVLVVSSVAMAAGKRSPITKLTVDPDAEVVELFTGIDQEIIKVKMIAKDAYQGNLLVENLTDKPVTVELPKSIVGVQVLEQACGLLGGGCGGLGGGGGGGGLGGGSSSGSQSVGGGLGGGGGGLGGGGGGGFFSIPPEKVVKVPYKSVCLDHGKADPSSRVNYQVIPTDEYTDVESLQELLDAFGTNRIDRQTVQAAAWHLNNGMTWEELASKKVDRLGGLPPVPYFSQDQLSGAQQLVTQVESIVREKKKDSEDKDNKDEDQPRRSPRTRTQETR